MWGLYGVLCIGLFFIKVVDISLLEVRQEWGGWGMHDPKGPGSVYHARSSQGTKGIYTPTVAKNFILLRPELL